MISTSGRQFVRGRSKAEVRPPTRAFDLAIGDLDTAFGDGRLDFRVLLESQWLHRLPEEHGGCADRINRSVAPRKQEPVAGVGLEVERADAVEHERSRTQTCSGRAGCRQFRPPGSVA
jgi:hypothetical protein